MKLHETNWDAVGGAAMVEVEYPDQIIADFVNWIRKTTAWLENPEIVERRVRRLNSDLSLARTVTMVTQAETPLKTQFVSVADKRRASLAKARAAKQAKKLQEAGHG